MKKNLHGLLFLTLSSCSVFDGNTDSKVELKRSWQLEYFFDESGDKIDLNEDEPLTIRFLNDNEVSGDADCNVFGGKYMAKENGDIKLKNIFATEIACEEPTFGYRYLNAILSVTDFINEEERLILTYDKDGKLIFLERLE